MSISASLNKALEMKKILDLPIKIWDFPILRTMDNKTVAIHCRRCDGLGMEPEQKVDRTVDEKIQLLPCAQCGGSGVEKLGMKAIRRAQRKLKEQEDQLEAQAKIAKEIESRVSN